MAPRPKGPENAMYICVCNGLTDEQVNLALANGAKSANAVYRCFGCKAQCGKCARMIRARAKEIRAGLPVNDDYGCAAAE